MNVLWISGFSIFVACMVAVAVYFGFPAVMQWLFKIR